jgi:hypothetical protein
MTVKQLRQQPLLGTKLTSNSLNHNNKGTAGNGVFYTVCVKGLYNEDTVEESVESQSMKRRLEGWCEIATRLEVGQLKH